MNGFEMHGLEHSSISQINKWIGCPSAWVSQYLFGNKSPATPAMWRGIFTEEAVADTLMGMDIGNAIAKAESNFDNKQDFGDDRTEKERANIKPMTELAVEALSLYGKPDFPEDGQHRVSMKAKGDGWEIEFMGFIDFKSASVLSEGQRQHGGEVPVLHPKEVRDERRRGRRRTDGRD
jgi:hypothetical protein